MSHSLYLFCRGSVVDKLLNSMYEKIHGPVPQTPNGSRDTPRMRNQKQRDQGLDDDKFAVKYDASSEWTSSNDVVGLQSLSDVCVNESVEKKSDLLQKSREGSCSQKHSSADRLTPLCKSAKVGIFYL